MKKYIPLCLVLILLLNTPISVFASDIKTPDVEAHGAVLMEFNSGRVLWEKDSHKKLAIASTTKIMTSILALEMGNPDDIVTVSKRAAAAPPVKMHISAGEKISLQSLLYALMLQSSNDAAVAIAEHIGGTVEHFCEMMTEKAAQIGATDTVFETPNGLDTDNHMSTAYDVALIARYALSNEDFVDLINTRSVTVKSNIRNYDITNKNRLLSEFDGANGVKTGYTGKAGHCFVGAAKRDGMQLISVVLASGWGDRGREQKWVDTKRLLNYGFNNFSFYEIVKANDKAATISINRSRTEDLQLLFGKGLSLPLTASEKNSIMVDISIDDNIKAPVEPGDKLGEARVYYGNELLSEIDLCAESGADRHDLKTCLEKTLNSLLGLTTRVKADIILPEWYYSE